MPSDHADPSTGQSSRPSSEVRPIPEPSLRKLTLTSVAAMVYISAKLTMVMLAVVPPVSIGAVIYGRYLRKLSNQTQEALGEMSKVSRVGCADVGD